VLSDPTPYNVFIRCGLAATRLTDFKDGELMCASGGLLPLLHAGSKCYRPFAK